MLECFLYFTIEGQWFFVISNSIESFSSARKSMFVFPRM
ncbi:hypothetical protein H7S56_15530 [Priestia aryabhattai]|nr:hypothetical protein [Priestia aryabhattai]